MKTSHLKWLIMFGCCLSVMECVYQLFFYFSFAKNLMVKKRCLHIGTDNLAIAFRNYQFNYDHHCVHRNATFKRFISHKALESVDLPMLEFIEELNKNPKRSDTMAMVNSNILLYWLLINMCQIIASVLLYWVAITPSAYHTRVAFYIMLPWSILVVIIFFMDITTTIFAGYIFHKCKLPSTCVLWTGFLEPNPVHYEKFDSYAVTPDSSLYSHITNAPVMFLIVAGKHLVGSPILMIVLIIMCCEYKKRRRAAVVIAN